MAGEEIVGGVVYEVGVRDNTRAGLEQIQARIRRASSEIERDGATVRIKGDISALDHAIKEAKLRERQLAEEQMRLEKEKQGVAAFGARSAQKERTNRLRDIELERAAFAKHITQVERESALLKEQYTLKKAAAQQDAQTAREAQRSFADEMRRLDYKERAGLRELDHQRELLKLQAAYDKKQQEIDARARLPIKQRDQPSERYRIKLEDERALVEMKIFQEKAKLLGGTVTKRIEIDTHGATNKLRAFLGVAKDSPSAFDGLRTALGGLSEKIKGVGSGSGGARVSIFGLSTSVRTLGIAASVASPLIVGLLGGIGSLISVMGAGVAGAAGIGASAMAGFGMAAIGVKAAISGQLQQLSVFKAAMNSYQKAQLLYGPPGPKPLTASQQRTAANRSAQVPLIQQRIGIDQQAVTTALQNYGAGSMQAQRASLALASAQQRLSTAQQGVVGTTNQTQKALDKMNMVIKQSDPAMRAAERGWLNLAMSWRHLTGTVAKRDFGQVLADAFAAANANVKWFAKDTNATMGAFTIGFHKWMAGLSTPGAGRVLDNIFSNFTKSLPSIMDGLGHLAAVLGRLLSNFSNYLPGFAKGFDAWATGLDMASKKSSGFAHGVQVTVGAFKSLGEFIGTALRTLLTFFSLGIKPGEGLLDSATSSLDRWNTSMQTTGKSKAMDFFKNGATTLAEFVGLISPLIGLITKFANALGPALNLTLKWAGAITQAAAAIMTFKPAQFAVGGIALLALVTRLGRGFWDASKAAGAFGANTLRALSQIQEKGIRGAFSSNFNVSGADKMLLAHKEGGTYAADSIYAAMVKGSTVASGEMATGVARGGAAAGGEIRLAEATGMSGASAANVGSGAAAAEAGAIGSLKGGAMKLLKGAGIAGGGVMLSQVAGGLIPGKAGQAVSTIGSMASVGAGFGSLLGPPGMFAGAVAAGLLGGFLSFYHHHAVNMGQKIADAVTAPMGPSIAAQYAKTIKHAVNEGNKYLDASRQPHTAPGQGRGGGQQTTGAGDQAAKDAWNAQWEFNRAGEASGKAFVDSYKGATKPEQFMFLQDNMRYALHHIKEQMRPAAAETMLQFAHGLQEKGLITKQRFQEILDQMKATVKGLPAYLAKKGEDTAAGFTYALDFRKAQTKLVATVQAFRDTFHNMNMAWKITGSNLGQQTDIMAAALQYKMHHGSKKAREAAEAQWDILKTNTNRVFDLVARDVGTKMDNIKDNTHLNSRQVADLAGKNFGSFQQSVHDAMKSGTISTHDGTKLILRVLHDALKKLSPGKAPISMVVESAALSSPNYKPGALFATGGRVPGPVSGDNWTLVDPAGRPAGKVGGGEILVANRHTEQRVDSMLARHGTSLAHEVHSEGRAHSAPLKRHARGGRVVTASDYGGPNDPGAYMHTTASGKVMDNNLVGFAELSNPPGSLNFSALGHLPMGTMLPVTYGGKTINIPKVDVGAGGPGVGGHVRAIDLTQPAANQLHFPGLADVIVGNPSGINLGSMGGGTWQALRTPKTRGGGLIGDIVHSVLSKVTDAANKFGQSHMPAPSVLGGGGGPGPVFAPTKGPLPAAVQWALQAANTLADRHPPYGHDGAGWGLGAYDCSSYVSTVMDAAGIWPKWAYYTAAGPINAHTDPGPGKYITIGTWGSSGQAAHTMMEIDGHFFESGGGDGGPHRNAGWSMKFDQYRHPRGYARGGRLHKRGNPGIGNPGYQPTQAEADEIQHKQPTRVKYAGAFANGGSFTTNGPTVGLFGEAGVPETVIAIPHASTGNIFRSQIAHPPSVHAPSTHSHSHHATSHHSPSGRPLDRATKIASQDDLSLDKAEAAAQDAYNKELLRIGIDSAAHKVGKPGHYVGTFAKLLPNGRHVGSKRVWVPSTIHTAGGVTKAQQLRLSELWRTLQDIKAAEGKADKVEKKGLRSVHDIPPQDRIGGVGTADISEAITAAQGDLAAYQQIIRNQTRLVGSGKHKHAVHMKPTKAQLSEEAKLNRNVNRLQKVLATANTDISKFTAIEDELGLLGTYMDTAGASPSDQAAGYDPGMGAEPALAKSPVTLTWDEWKKRRMYWENKHTSMLQSAADRVGKILGKEGKNQDGREVAYLRTLITDLGTADADQQALNDLKDPNAPAAMTSVDDYIARHPPDLPTIQRLNYDFSVAQGQVLPDNPGTPQREDIISMKPEVDTAAQIRDFYGSVFTAMQNDPDPGVSQNYPLLTSASDAYNSAKSTWQGLNDTVTQATNAMGPTQFALNDTARAAVLQSYGGNTAAPSAAAFTGGTMASAEMQAGGGSPASMARAMMGGSSAAAMMGPGVSASSSSGGSGAGGGGGKITNITNNYQTQPADPHSWSQGLAWELGSAI